MSLALWVYFTLFRRDQLRSFFFFFFLRASPLYIKYAAFSYIFYCCSVTKSCPILCDCMNCSMPGFRVLHYLLEFSQTHVQWLSDAIQPYHTLCLNHTSCLQSFPASRSFPMSQLLASGGQRIGASTSASVLAMHIQYWFPLGLTGLTSLLFKGLSRVFFNTTVQKHQFFSVQPSFWSNSQILTFLLKKTKSFGFSI